MNKSEINILLKPLKERNKKCSISEDKSAKHLSDIKKWIYQFAAVFSVSLVTMGFGVIELWTSPALPYLRTKESGFSITPDQSSLILSLLNAGTVLGCLLFPVITNKIGLKYSLLIFTVPQIIAYTMISLAKSVTILYLARFIGGIGYGLCYVCQIIYIGEISHKKIRGTLMFITRIFYLIGTVFVLILGAFLSYDTMNWIVLSIPIIFIVTFSFMPESPYFYLKQHRGEEAYKSLSKLRGIQDPEILNQEISIMREFIEEDARSKKHAFRRLFQDQGQRSALMIVVIIEAGVILSGVRAITAMGQDILSLTDSPLSPRYVYLIVIIVVSVLCLPTACIADKLGRRLTLLLSSAICSLCLIAIGVVFFLKYEYQHDITSISWISLVAMIIFETSCISGLLTIAVVVIGELFSPQVKNIASPFLIIVKEMFVFFTKFCHDKLVPLIGIYGIFWMYSLLSFVLCFIGFLVMPETKGKTLEEIQILLNRRKKRNYVEEDWKELDYKNVAENNKQNVLIDRTRID